MSEQLTVIGDGEFKVVRRGGYDREEVDSYIARLRRQVQELQEMQTPDGAVKRALEQVGEEVAGILQQAHETASEITSSSQVAADERRAAADHHAADVTASAQERVRALDLDADRIWAERERIVADARDLARQLLELADAAAERFPDESPAVDAAD